MDSKEATFDLCSFIPLVVPLFPFGRCFVLTVINLRRGDTDERDFIEAAHWFPLHYSCVPWAA